MEQNGKLLLIKQGEEAQERILSAFYEDGKDLYWQGKKYRKEY